MTGDGSTAGSPLDDSSTDENSTAGSSTADGALDGTVAARTSGGFRRLDERDVHQGYIWKLVTADFESPDGETFSRDFVRSPGAVGVLPLLFDAEGNPSVVLIRQYRPPYEELVIEMPAGMRDIPGEATDEVARRELIEEAGLAASEVTYLTEIYPSPGLTDSVTTLYLATGCTPVPNDRQGPEERHMDVVHVPLDDAVAMVERAEITDAKTVVAILLTARRLAASD